MKNILAKFVKPAVIAEGLKNDDGLLSVNFKDKANRVSNNNLVIGYTTKRILQRLLDEGDISLYQQTTFFDADKAFFIKATEYLLKWCPLKDELLLNSTWLDFEKRLEKCFTSVEYFVLKYPEIFP